MTQSNYKLGLPYLYIIRSNNKLVATDQNNNYTVLIRKPQENTTTFLLKTVGISTNYRSGSADPAYRGVDFQINFPSVGFDTSSNSGSYSVGQLTYSVTDDNFIGNNFNYEKIITLSSDGVYNVRVFTDGGVLATIVGLNGGLGFPDNVISFTLTPVFY